jgi:alpha-glucosidase
MASDEFSGNYMEKARPTEGWADLFPGTIRTIHQPSPAVVELLTDNLVLLRIHVLEEGMVRFRFSVEGRFETDFSYALDPDFKPDPPACEVIEFGDGVAIRTAALSIRVSRNGLKTTISDAQTGKVLCQDEKGFHWQENKSFGGEVVKMMKAYQPGEHFYGLGDKSCDLNLRGRKFDLWGSDTYAFGPESDPLYKNIPFYIGMHRGGTYGIFFDNTFRTRFDFGAEQPGRTAFSAEGGEMDYYFIHAAEPLEVVRSYTRLTGRPGMPPLWALGYHQCKWSYYPDAVFRAIGQGFRDRRIPCDALYLDIDYMDGYRCFTWDAERFPDPKGMVAALEEDGFKTVVIIDPGLKIDPEYKVWQDGIERDVFCRRQDGNLAKGSVWPGLCHFPDFTRPDVRHWWADQFQELIEEIGVRGVWNDMNEPAVFEEGTFPNDVRHDYDGHPCSHRKAHNIYGMQMVRATQEGLRRFGNGRRTFSITRSAYAGTQRHACAWTGDNIASWEHLHIASLQCQRLAISGMSFVGSDVGGFIETPSGELYLRWVQMAVFHPFFRTHSSGDHGDQEPWSFGDEITELVKQAIELRYRLLPVIYSTFWQYVSEGMPMLRPMPLVAHQDPDAFWRSTEFFFGDHLLIIPMTRQGEEGRYLYLPDGEWYSYHDDYHPNVIRKDIWVDCPLDRIPIFVRSGAVLPHWPLQQYVGEIEHPEPNLLVWWKNGTEQSRWYEDDGDGQAWRDGVYRDSTFTVTGSPTTLKLERSWSGQWTPGYEQILMTLRGLPKGHTQVEATVDGKRVGIDKTPDGYFSFALPPDFRTVECSWSMNPAVKPEILEGVAASMV